MEAVHLCEPSPQRTPVLFQAGSSGRGRAFAGSHAECVFLNGQGHAAVRAHVEAIREAAVSAGRGRGDVLAFVGATVIVAETSALAEAKLADYRRYASPEGALVHASASMGIDLERFGMDEPIGGQSNAITSNLAAMAQEGMTKRKLLERMVLGSRQVPIVGDPGQVADALTGWVEQSDVDGFILSRTVTPECFEDFVELVVPELQRRGIYKERYAVGTLREKLFGGGRMLGSAHPAAGFRNG